MQLSNDRPLISWVLSAGFTLGGLVPAVTRLRGDAPPSLWSILLPAGFCLISLLLTIRSMQRPCVHVVVRSDRLVCIEKRYPLRRESLRLRPEQITALRLVADVDAESFTYYSVQLQPVSGPAVVISEGSDKAGCEAIRRQCAAALGKP